MKPIVTMIAVLLAATGAQPGGSQDAPAKALQSWSFFEKGRDVLVCLSYSGGLEGWDAAFGYHEGRLTTANSAFITVTDAKGKKLSARPDKLYSKSFNQMAKKPFDTRVNLAEVYDMSTPGRYIVEWGCEKVASQAIRIEIVKQQP